jgi:transcriptional regulator with XRE-family HTH domain
MSLASLMNVLSDTLRELMDRHGLTGVKLAEDIGISAVSVSNILTGKSRPRQVTLSRMMKRLCENKEDKQALLSAYESLGSAKLPVSPVVDDEVNAATEEERVRRFLEVKTQAVAFRNSVQSALDAIPITYQADFSKGSVITDFLIEKDRKRIALECRANVMRDLEKSLLSARIIRDEMGCDQVFIVVPEFDDDLRDACASEINIHDLVVREIASARFMTDD